MFHSNGPIDKVEVDGDTRMFTLDVMPNNMQHIDLPVPGLTSVSAVRIGNMPLPPRHVYEVPDSQNFMKKLTVAPPMYQLTRNYEGVPVLRRNQMSNDGFWQSGIKIYVTGKWEAGTEIDEPKGAPMAYAAVDPGKSLPAVSVRK